MELKFSDEQMREVVRGAILKAMDDRDREAMIASALEYLMTSQRSEYSSYSSLLTSPLEDAFRRAVTRETERIVEQSIRCDEGIARKIKEAITQAGENFLKSSSEGLASAMGAALTAAFQRGRDAD